jgi:hypothetical protein
MIVNALAACNSTSNDETPYALVLRFKIHALLKNAAKSLASIRIKKCPVP